MADWFLTWPRGRGMPTVTGCGPAVAASLVITSGTTVGTGAGRCCLPLAGETPAGGAAFRGKGKEVVMYSLLVCRHAKRVGRQQHGPHPRLGLARKGAHSVHVGWKKVRRWRTRGAHCRGQTPHLGSRR